MPPPDDRPYNWRDDYDEQPPSRQGTSPVLIIVLVLGGLFMLGVLACGAFAFIGWRAAPVPQQGPPVAVQADPLKGAKGMTRVYTRQEFRDLVMGKTQSEVIAAVGKPDSTQDDGLGVNWYYYNRTTDPVAGKIDGSAQVVFKGGRVTAVNY
jgi:hypothetical protein